MVGRITVVSLLSPLPMAPDYPSRPFGFDVEGLTGAARTARASIESEGVAAVHVTLQAAGAQ